MDIDLGMLVGILFVLILLSAFFSSSETGLMTLNRYRLRHLVKIKHPGAVRASRLLEKPDKLIGLILLGNNLVNFAASAIATLIAIKIARIYGLSESTVTSIAVVLLTIIFLIFAEVAPKTLAAIKPERIAFPAAYIYGPLLKLMYPLVISVNYLAHKILGLISVSPEDSASLHLNSEELRTVVNEAGALIPRRHQRMLVSILDLERVTVEDIMVPRNEVTGINIEDSWKEIEEILMTSPYTKLPLFQGSMDDVLGFIHLRDVVRISQEEEDFDQAKLLEISTETYFIPEGTPLNTQLLNFQRQRARVGLVVNEYGDIQGLVTMEDILEEIVGEFTTDPSTMHKDITPQDDGSWLVDGSAHIRDINRTLQLELPTGGPKTINGLILEYMETIPAPDTSLLISNYPIDIIQTKDNAIKTVRIQPAINRPTPQIAEPDSTSEDSEVKSDSEPAVSSDDKTQDDQSPS